jgi:hypothetical protein
MNRRQLLAGVAALPLMSVPAIAAITKNEPFATAINLLGMKVEYSKELAKDLVAVHGLHPVEIIEKMYGTEFRIEKEISLNKKFLNFWITTDDKRDNFTRWMLYEHEIGTPNGAYWKRIDAKGIPAKEWFHNWASPKWVNVL